jgi:hypothetical protein
MIAALTESTQPPERPLFQDASKALELISRGSSPSEPVEVRAADGAAAGPKSVEGEASAECCDFPCCEWPCC